MFEWSVMEYNIYTACLSACQLLAQESESVILLQDLFPSHAQFLLP